MTVRPVDDATIATLVFEADAALRKLFDQFFALCDEIRPSLFATPGAVKKALDEGYTPFVSVVDFEGLPAHEAADLCETVGRATWDGNLMIIASEPDAVETLLGSRVAAKDYLRRPFSFQNLLQRIQLVAAPSQGKMEFSFHPGTSLEEIRKLRARMDENPENVVVRNMLAFALYTTDQFAEALEHFRFVAERNEATFFTRYYMGQTYARLGNLTLAVSCWNRALEFELPDEVRKRVLRRIEKARQAGGLEQEGR